MNVTTGILAHVDAGKTTLSEQLLYHCGATRTLGRVDRGDTLLDCAPVERERGITVFTGHANFTHNGNHYFLLDTPGHTDFRPELERCLAALDCAILVVPCTDGPTLRTERLWHILAEHGIPVILFLNKTDIPGSDPQASLSALEERLNVRFCDLTNGLTEDAREQTALTSEEAMEACLTGEWTDEACMRTASAAVSKRELFPVITGSALNGTGIKALLDCLDNLAPGLDGNGGPVEFLACQVRRDRQGERYIIGRVLSGELRPRQQLGGEKIHELRRCQGGRQTPLDRAETGELCAITGLAGLRAGDRASSNEIIRPPFSPPPLLASVESELPPAKLLEIFRILEDEEPALAVRWKDGAVHLALSGELMPEVLARNVKERFGAEITFGERRAAYRETIAKPVRGCGHYEPLRHYAEVHLLLEPGERGSGVVFESRCPADSLARNWQRLIETHVLEREHPGPLTGSPLTDVRVILLAGKAHEKHTEGGDFRQAVYRAIRQGLFSGETVLLEPYYRFVIQAGLTIAGRVQNDLRRLDAILETVERVGEGVRLTGRCPVEGMAAYAGEFAGIVRGQAELTLMDGGYEPCRDTETVVRTVGYDRERDTENPAGSIFCSHGAGHPVSWREAPDHMHVEVRT